MRFLQVSPQERRYVNIVFFIFVLLPLAAGLKELVVDYSERHWDALEESRAVGFLDDVGSLVGSLQRETRRIATDLAQHPVVVTSLLHRDVDAVPLFDHLATVREKQDVGMEIYNTAGELIAWDGISGTAHTEEIALALKGQLTSFITTSALHSQLFVLTPVRNQGNVVGVVLLRRIVEAYYPLNNKYIDRQGLTERVREGLGFTAAFDFSGEARLPAIEGYASAPLYGIDSSRIGVVTVPRPTLSSYLENLESGFRVVNGIVYTLLICFVSLLFWQRIQRVRHIFWRSATLTILIWLTRYALLWLEIPSSHLGGPFDPVHYASKFGGGLAKSVGDLSLTSLALLLNVLIVAHSVVEILKNFPWWRPRSLPVRLILVPPLTVLLFFLLRGYGATIRSAVFDSVLMYADPIIVVPSFELGMMIVNLFVLSFCLIVMSVGLTSFLVSLVSPRSMKGSSAILPWVAIGVILIVVAVAFEYGDIHPVVGPAVRILFAACILLYTAHLHRQALHRRPLRTPGSFLIALGLAAVFLYPLLAQKIDEKDRDRVEIFATEFLRPVDTWLTFVVDEALQMFNQPEAKGALLSGQPEQIDRIALTLWAKSSVCREGYSCLFSLMDTTGKEVSRFSIGNRGLLDGRGGMVSRGGAPRGVRVQQLGTGVNAVKVYRGAAPIMQAGRTLAYAVVVVAAEQQALFRGESPSFLRSPSPGSLESFYRQVTVAEFRDGTLFASTNETFPERLPLPEPVKARLESSTPSSFWSSLSIGDHRYETFVVRGTVDNRQVIALCLPEQDVPWHLFSLVKMLLYYSLVVILSITGYLLLQLWRGTPYRVTFRDRLLAALLVTAMLPMLVIGYYGKTFAEQRLIDETAAWLGRETDVVAFQILQLLENRESGYGAKLNADLVEEIASDLGTDFNFYVNNTLSGTSRPELYAAGLLDPRLSGSAFSALVVRGEKFHHQSENVGRYRYAVGYRAVSDDSGILRGIVSVPTLYRQEKVEQEVTRQNTLLFGAYAVVFFVILIIATTFASRIASPIQRLTEATRRVAAGQLDVTLNIQHADGEIGELVRSFDGMLHDLKKNRDEMVRYERELAWKEMAKQVAHEIKNPLTPMKLSMQHLRQTYRDGVADFGLILDEVTRTVIEQIDALGRIASEFSRFGRMPRPSLQPCDINVVLDEAIHLFAQEEGIVWEKTLDSTRSVILADKEELRRAFINVIRNGIQAMNGRGTISVKTHREKNEMQIAIRDTGEGILEELQGKLFQPNFSTRTDGMGLGLAMVKNTIESLHGTITIGSKPGEGAEVKIVLPLDNTRKEPAQSPIPPKE